MIRDDDDTAAEIERAMTVVRAMTTHAGDCALLLRVVHERAEARAAAHPVVLPPGAGLSVERETEQRV